MLTNILKEILKEQEEPKDVISAKIDDLTVILSAKRVENEVAYDEDRIPVAITVYDILKNGRSVAELLNKSKLKQSGDDTFRDRVFDWVYDTSQLLGGAKCDLSKLFFQFNYKKVGNVVDKLKVFKGKAFKNSMYGKCVINDLQLHPDKGVVVMIEVEHPPYFSSSDRNAIKQYTDRLVDDVKKKLKYINVDTDPTIYANCYIN